MLELEVEIVILILWATPCVELQDNNLKGDLLSFPFVLRASVSFIFIANISYCTARLVIDKPHNVFYKPSVGTEDV